jgi:hypothetical protein
MWLRQLAQRQPVAARAEAVEDEADVAAAAGAARVVAVRRQTRAPRARVQRESCSCNWTQYRR